MTRQQYRQLQRKRPDLKLPDWSTFFPLYREKVLKVLTPEELIPRRTAMLLEGGSQTKGWDEFEMNRPAWLKGVPNYRVLATGASKAKFNELPLFGDDDKPGPVLGIF